MCLFIKLSLSWLVRMQQYIYVLFLGQMYENKSQANTIARCIRMYCAGCVHCAAAVLMIACLPFYYTYLLYIHTYCIR